MNLKLLKDNPNWAEVIVRLQFWNARIAKAEGNRYNAAYWALARAEQLSFPVLIFNSRQFVKFA